MAPRTAIYRPFYSLYTLILKCPAVGSQRVVTWPNYFKTIQLFINRPKTATFTVVEGKFCSF